MRALTEKKVLFIGVDELSDELAELGLELQSGNVYAPVPAEVIYLGKHKDNKIHVLVLGEDRVVFVKETNPDPFCRAYAGDPIRVSIMKPKDLATFMAKVAGTLAKLSK